MKSGLDAATVVWRFIFACLLAVTSEAWSAANTYWLPIQDGVSLSFSVSGDRSDSEGHVEVFGPTMETTHFTAVDVQVFDHHATLRGSNGTNTFYAFETSEGIFQISDGDPLAGGWYEYYTDPAPFSTRALQDVGQTLHYSGQWRGQWEVPGGGYQAWNGHWESAITNLGVETITLPQGAFDAVKFQEIEHYDKSPDGVHVNRTTVTSHTWILEGTAVLKRTEDWYDESDFDGDDIVDAWSREHLVMVAVPEPGTWGLLVAGGVVLLRAWKARVGT